MTKLGAISTPYDRAFLDHMDSDYETVLNALRECHAKLQRENAGSPLRLMMSELCFVQRTAIAACNRGETTPTLIHYFDALMNIATAFSYVPIAELEIVLDQIIRHGGADVVDKQRQMVALTESFRAKIR
jgi:hypothetical protein